MKHRKAIFWIALVATVSVTILAVYLLVNHLSKEFSTMQGGGQAVSNFEAYDTFSFSELQPTQTTIYSDSLTFSEDSSELKFAATWTPSGLSVEVGLIAQDGKEYVAKISGGSASGTINDIPPGTYQVFLRNSEINMDHKDTANNLTVSGAVAFDF